MADKLTISLTILLTGFVVVFAVLLLLIGIIKLYGTVVYRIQTGRKEKPVVIPTPSTSEPSPEPVAVVESSADPDALIAVISAAVYAVYPSDQVRIKSIRKAPVRSNEWHRAGLNDSIRPF